MKMRSINGLVFVLAAVMMVSFVGTAYAQQGDEIPTVAVLFWHGNDAFYDEMANLGYVSGENIIYMDITYEGVEDADRQAHAAELRQAMIDSPDVDVYVVNTDADAVELHPLVGDRPIVFARTGDPIGSGAVDDLINPGRNMTGTVTNKPHKRRLQILTEILPTTDKVYYLHNPSAGQSELILAEVLEVAEQLGIEIIVAPVTDTQTGLEALANMPEGTDWLFPMAYTPITDSEFMDALRAVSQEHQIGIAYITDTPPQGVLLGYGANIGETDRQAAQIVDRILRGADASSLPIQTAENYFAVNLEAADALGIVIPVGVLNQANTIIRPGDFDTPEDDAGSE